MIKNLISKIRTKCESLYLGLIFNILLGIAVGVTVYALIQLVSDSYIRLNYASEERRDEREAQEIEELKTFIDTNDIQDDDIARIAEWASDKRYLYLMLYNGTRLVYTSDLGVIPSDGTIPESSETVVNSGLTVDHPTNATLRRHASAGERFTLKIGESVFSAAVYDYSEYMQYDVINILSMVFAFVALCSIIINYFRRIVKRIRRLEAEVTIVTHSNMEHKVVSRGLDELGRLASNIENMREAILENLKKEREARDSNTELITAMSHDIRTPLTVLLGYLEMMKAEVENQPLLAEYLETSERTALRLKQLSDDIFKYSLAFGNSLDNLVLEPYDAGMLFEQMLSEHVLLLRENGYTAVVNNELGELATGTVVVTEPQNLMRILDNVFSNVRKYADIEQPVSITARRGDGGRIIFECANTIRTDTYKAESNKIGLKTCERLAEKIAEKFEYGADGEMFVARLYMQTKLLAPEVEDEAPKEESEARKKRRGVFGLFDSARGFFARVFKKVKHVFGGKKDAGEHVLHRVSGRLPGIKPIGYAVTKEIPSDVIAALAVENGDERTDIHNVISCASVKAPVANSSDGATAVDSKPLESNSVAVGASDAKERGEHSAKVNADNSNTGIGAMGADAGLSATDSTAYEIGAKLSAENAPFEIGEKPVMIGDGGELGAELAMPSAVGGANGADPAMPSAVGGANGADPAMPSAVGGANGADQAMSSAVGCANGAEPAMPSVVGCGVGAEPFTESISASGDVSKAQALDLTDGETLEKVAKVSENSECPDAYSCDGAEGAEKSISDTGATAFAKEDELQ